MRGFDACPQRQFVIESINTNSLTYHLIWSTIKNLPATLPELSFKFRGWSAGVTVAGSYLELDHYLGVGLQGAGNGPWIADLG